ncbi:hypothetical protein EYR41_000214 [Orbilia oligospora]|uniref:Uncharacterized protein n=1 Tax=Orbilia oligospora TaxID=2813651 RepID=A0A8H2HSZ4_ORBOL|nr:hypothetical protein TWF217_011255 [Orbilia oligospora]KAF3296313.1 hypothetical protein TWF132_010911 [Orbilia oligospora]TGJ73095.1 hypothetical protein EYR41_000214 [Orbilia oligospora]
MLKYKSRKGHTHIRYKSRIRLPNRLKNIESHPIISIKRILSIIYTARASDETPSPNNTRSTVSEPGSFQSHLQ